MNFLQLAQDYNKSAVIRQPTVYIIAREISTRLQMDLLLNIHLNKYAVCILAGLG